MSVQIKVSKEGKQEGIKKQLAHEIVSENEHRMTYTNCTNISLNIFIYHIESRRLLHVADKDNGVVILLVSGFR